MSNTAQGVFKEAKKNAQGFWSAVIEGTGLETKYFGVGKYAPKVAANTTVKFEYSTKEYGDKTYYNVEGKLEAVGGASAAQGVSGSVGNSGSDPRQDSIETQSSIASASRIVAAQIHAGVNIANPSQAVASLVADFKAILKGKPPTPKPAPKPIPVEDQSQDPEDDIPF